MGKKKKTKFVYENGQPAYYGDELCITIKSKAGETSFKVHVSENIIQSMLSVGVVFERNIPRTQEELEALWTTQNNCEDFEMKLLTMKCLKEENPAAALQILARLLAIQMDYKYDGNIRNCKKLYTISHDGNMLILDEGEARKTKFIPYFRTIEDFCYAQEVLKDLWNKAYK